MNGSTLSWNEASPANAESAGSGATILRSLQTSIRFGLNDEHNWPSSGGDNVGYHRYGSARPYFGTQSRVSSSGSDGRIMMTSDTSRLFGVGSGGTVLIGGATVNSFGTFPGAVPQRHQWVEEFGTVVTNSAGSAHVVFPNSGFSGIPYTWLTAYSFASTSTFSPVPTASVDTASTQTTLKINTQSLAADGSARFTATTVYWRSVGTRVL